ncbi:MAG: hypothetical protein K8R50_07395 [Betaproteobacteria bacterium]|nr:hypothetical protein [Betaproteobacteria bacterium]
MIQIIPLDKTLPGMVLGKVLMSCSNMLLPLGMVINTSHIDSLRRCGVSKIIVLAPSELTVAEIDERREAPRGRVVTPHATKIPPGKRYNHFCTSTNCLVRE